MPTVNMVQNDTAPTLTINITRSGNPVNVAGSIVRFKIKNNDTAARTNDAANTCTIVSAAGGQVTYTFNAGDIPSPTTYTCDVEITYASGKVETPFEPITIIARAEA